MKNRLLVAVLFVLAGCDQSITSEVTSKLPEKRVSVPLFNADSAYLFIEDQVKFGPRVPNTPEHRKTGDYIVSKLKSFGAVITEQTFNAVTFDNNNVGLRNIIASFQPDVKKRILLAAHWDTRPYADKEEDAEKWNIPIDGANDGASGVAVLLEIARAMAADTLSLSVGIDMIFFDGEDWGDLYKESTSLQGDIESWYCLGSQYWSKNKHQSNYSAYYGILLDMVGAKNATFRMEGNSMNYAPSIMKKVWDWGNVLGHGSLFLYDKKQAITDDHVFVNEYAKIPMIDIVHYDDLNGYFGDYHHTLNDNLSVIDKNVLKGVGETLLYVLYHE